MARVTGIGGVFLRSADPKALGAWYEAIGSRGGARVDDLDVLLRDLA